ncbi:hypothetical protein TNCV_4769651 [Trichonephila clavipes]|nr:hypothetical protein TNCV_4769651 [Trichonephila clavipes]
MRFSTQQSVRQKGKSINSPMIYSASPLQGQELSPNAKEFPSPKHGLVKNVGASRFNALYGRQGCILTWTVESNQGGRFDGNEFVADSFRSGANALNDFGLQAVLGISQALQELCHYIVGCVTQLWDDGCFSNFRS